MKVCVDCGEEKEDECFYNNRKGKHSRCKPCYRKRNSSYQKRYRYKNRFAIRVRSCKARAKECDLPFDITENHLKEIWTDVCPAFGTPLDIKAKKSEEGHAQLDRVVPRKGYTIGNVVWLSQRANRIKDDATIEDLERLLEWLKSL